MFLLSNPNINVFFNGLFVYQTFLLLNYFYFDIYYRLISVHHVFISHLLLFSLIKLYFTYEINNELII